MQEEIETWVISYHLKDLSQLIENLIKNRKIQAQVQGQMSSLTDSFQIFQGKISPSFT